MKVDAFKKKDYSFTADLYTFTKTTDAAGGQVLNYKLARTIQLAAVTGMFGKMTVYFQDSEEDVVVNCQLQNLKDASGIEMNPGYIWAIDQFAPNINMWGHREGFRGRITFFGTPA